LGIISWAVAPIAEHSVSIAINLCRAPRLRVSHSVCAFCVLFPPRFEGKHTRYSSLGTTHGLTLDFLDRLVPDGGAVRCNLRGGGRGRCGRGGGGGGRCVGRQGLHLGASEGGRTSKDPSAGARAGGGGNVAQALRGTLISYSLLAEEIAEKEGPIQVGGIGNNKPRGE